jgi:hypothetical protein
MACQKVSVEVSQDHVPDLELALPGILQVLINIPLRVNNCSSMALLVSNQVGSMSQTTQVVLFQNHGILTRTVAV